MPDRGLPREVSSAIAAYVVTINAIARGETPEDDPDILAQQAKEAALRAAESPDPWALAEPDQITVTEMVGRRFADLRRLAGIEQTAFAETMQAWGFETWSRQTVAEVQRGSRRLSYEELFAVAALFGVSVVSLLRADETELLLVDDPKRVRAEDDKRQGQVKAALRKKPAVLVDPDDMLELVLGVGGKEGRGGPNWVAAARVCPERITSPNEKDADRGVQRPARDLWKNREGGR